MLKHGNKNFLELINGNKKRGSTHREFFKISLILALWKDYNMIEKLVFLNLFLLIFLVSL